MAPAFERILLKLSGEALMGDLEYGTDCLEMHDDAVRKGQRVLIVDDLLATGGTARAATDLVKQLGHAPQ